MFKTVLWDIDGTLLNFEKAEDKSLKELFEKYGIDFDEQTLEDYKLINRQYWAKIEHHMIEREIALVSRFQEFFYSKGIMHIDCKKFNDEYQLALGRNFVVEEGALEICAKLDDMGIVQYAITNGSKVAQAIKIRKSHLDQYMRDEFISEELGYEKPDTRFFNVVRETTHYNPETTLVVGDGLTSDIRGGNYAGLKCCWYNPGHLRNIEGVHVDYEIDHLLKLVEII